MKIPVTRYRPVRTDDGQGGVTTTDDEGVTIWGVIQVYEDKPTLTGVDVNADVQIGDVIEVTE